jgi:hypothetical protein
VKLFLVLLSVRSSDVPYLLCDFNARLLIPREFFHLRAESSEPGDARADIPRVLRRDTSP